MKPVVAFFDTNLVVASSVPSHPHHSACLARMAKLKSTGAACSTHSLGELYGTLTSPSRYGFPPEVAVAIVKDIRKYFTVVSLSPEEYEIALEAAATLGIRGPLIYDALLVACARKVGARRIYTSNLKHFQQVAPDLASIIVEP